ncbi:hypothetical protein [Bacillus sp. REN10]|uniref:hypothetical protein n=1 Tax=Bacillus sp. REN10 TaxID=2782541 RepID=UPI00193B967F|nr:hypothetical protein [Bacillus sp. REN10]
MRLCVEGSESFNPFYIDELLSFLGEEIKKFNWIFTDIQGYVFHEGEEIILPEFEKETFMLTGNELHSIIQKYNILLVFGVVMCVKPDVNITDIEEFPYINNNKEYWGKGYSSPFKNTEIEFGFFDTTVVIVTTDHADLVDKFRKSVHEVSTLDSFLAEN